MAFHKIFDKDQSELLVKSIVHDFPEIAKETVVGKSGIKMVEVDARKYLVG